MHDESLSTPLRAAGAPRFALLAAPAAAAALCAGLLWAPAASASVEAGAAAVQDGATSQDEKKGADADEKTAGSKQKEAPRGRRGRGKTPPPPKVVPRSERKKPVVTPTDTPVPGVKGKEDPEAARERMEKQRKEYEAKLEAAGKAGAGKRRGAVPAPPKNPNAKLGIEFGTDKHDFGRVREGDQLLHVFEMTSAGSEPLVISQASPTCGCTLGEITFKAPGSDAFEPYTFGDPIPSGADVQLEAILDTGSKRNDTRVSIRIYSNDGKNPTTPLELKASVQPYIVTSPPIIQMGNIREGEGKTVTATFRTTNGDRIMLSQDPARKAPTPAGLTVDYEAINPDEEGKSNQWRATFTVAPDAKEGPGGYLLRLQSDVELPKNEKVEKAKQKAGKKGPTKMFFTCDASCSYNVLGALSMRPQYMSLGLIRPGQPVVRSARLTSHDDSFDLAGVTASVVGQNGQPLEFADAFSVEVKPVDGNPKAVDIELRLNGLPAETNSTFKGKVLVKTGHPAKPEMGVNFSGVCRKLAGAPSRPKTPVSKDTQKVPVKGGGK